MEMAVRTITLKNPIAIASAISVIAFSWLLLLIVRLRVLAKGFMKGLGGFLAATIPSFHVTDKLTG